MGEPYAIIEYVPEHNDSRRLGRNYTFRSQHRITTDVWFRCIKITVLVHFLFNGSLTAVVLIVDISLRYFWIACCCALGIPKYRVSKTFYKVLLVSMSHGTVSSSSKVSEDKVLRYARSVSITKQIHNSSWIGKHCPEVYCSLRFRRCSH